MKKYLFLGLILILFSSNFYGQDLDIKISLENANFWTLSKSGNLNLTLENKSAKNLDIKDFLPIRLYFSKCSKSEKCNKREDKFTASVYFKEKIINVNESLEIQINLADLYWSDAVLSGRDFSNPKNLQIVPIWNKYFYAEVTIIKGYAESKNLGKMALQESFLSNEIIFSTKPLAE